MKILIAANSYPTKKNPTHQLFIKNIYEGLKREGLETDLVYNPYFDYFKSDLKTGTVFSSVIKTISLFAAYLPFILFRARKYDIIYSHAPVWPGFYMLAAQKIHRVKHITYVHGSVNHYVKRRGFLYRLTYLTLQQCTAVVTNSSYMENRLRKEYDCESSIITPGYNELKFVYRNGTRNIDLLFAGSTIKRKGIRLLLETINRHKEFYQKKDFTIRMHFSGGHKRELIEYANKCGIEPLIQFGERLSENQLAEAYQQSKIFVFPSSEEPLGLVGIEAIACGAVLVGSNSGGIKEYLSDGYNGFLFEDGNADDLQRTIVKAYNYFPVFQKKQPAVSESVADYSLSAAMKQTVKFFHTI